jgi:CheY-like chemotaxis protein
MGKLELEMVPVHVEGVCQASLHFINQMAQRKRLEVFTNLDGAVATIQADERQLKQILVNLLSNAVKFTPEGGKIGLEVVGNAEQEAAYFTVWDNGMGIADENLERLFQPFVQLDSSLSRPYSGAGLGLALVQRLVNLHGGSISVESESGKGSRFTVALPWPAENLADRAEAESLTAEQTPKLSGAQPLIPVSNGKCQATSRLILLAEDNESSIRTVSDYLSVKGHRVIVVRNGGAAVDLARKERPEVILMDIQMPGMDGLEAIRRIRAEVELSKTPIIALTALAMRGDREKCLAAGANHYLSKPIHLKKLVEILETQLQ